MNCRTQSSSIVRLGWTAFIAFHLVFPSNIVAVPVACCEHDHNGDGRITEEDFDPLRAGHSLLISNCLDAQCPKKRPESGPPSPGGGGVAAPPLVPAPSPPADDNHEPPTPPDDDPAAPDEPDIPEEPQDPELPEDIDGPNPPKKSPCPVYLASGEKLEAQIDARVKLPGQDLIIWREYTSRQTPGTVWELGEGWTLSIFNSIRVLAIEGGYEIVRHGTPVTSTGVYVELPTQPGTYGCFGGGSSVRRTFTTGTLNADLVDPTTNLYTNLTRNVWRFNDPGRGQIDYYRNGGGTPAALEGRIAQERDTYGNVRTYDYFLFGPENGPKGSKAHSDTLLRSGVDRVRTSSRSGQLGLANRC